MRSLFFGLLVIVTAYIAVNAFETPIKYVSLKGETCSCWVSGEKLPSKDQCKLVGKKFELIRVQRCTEKGK